jgi:hypothetical protein
MSRKQFTMWLACALVIIAFCAAAIPLPWSKKSFTFRNGGISRVRIMSNTLNDNFVVFYQPLYPTWDAEIWVRTVSSDGNTLSSENVVTGFNVMRGIFSAAWHPVAKRYVIVFNDNNDLKAIATDVDGHPVSALNTIATGIDGEPHVTSLGNQRFVVFYRQGDQLWAWRLTKTAQKMKSPVQVSSFKKGYVKVGGAATEEDGQAVCYYSYIRGTSKSRGYMARVNNKLKVMLNKPVTAQMPDQWLTGIQGAYDPDTQTHAITFYNKFAIVDKNGQPATPSYANFIVVPNGGYSLAGVVYDRINTQFAAYYLKAWADEQTYTEYSYLYYAFFKSNGTIVESDFYFDGGTDETDGRCAGINRHGNRLGLISWEGGGGTGPVDATLWRKVSLITPNSISRVRKGSHD